MKYEKTTSAKDKINGTLHPQALKVSSPSPSRVDKITPKDTNNPSVAVV